MAKKIQVTTLTLKSKTLKLKFKKMGLKKEFIKLYFKMKIAKKIRSLQNQK
jgi:hypothetical protein